LRNRELLIDTLRRSSCRALRHRGAGQFAWLVHVWM